MLSPEITAVHPESTQENADLLTRIQNRVGEVSEGAVAELRELLEREVPPPDAALLTPEAQNYLATLDRTNREHSVAVMRLASETYGMYADDLQHENVSREIFLRAAALHDIGKIGWPEGFATANRSTAELRTLVEQCAAIDPGFLESRLGKPAHEWTNTDWARIRKDPRENISLAQYFSDKPALLEACQEAGYDVDNTSFMDVLRDHQPASTEAIRALDLPDRERIAALAGAHHNYEQPRVRSATTPHSEPGEMSSNLLRIIDITRALTQDRAYHRARSEAEALVTVAELAAKHEIEPAVASRWVAHQLPLLRGRLANQPADHPDRTALETVSHMLRALPQSPENEHAATAR